MLSSLKSQFSFRISAYVLMLNHVHLLLESGIKLEARGRTSASHPPERYAVIDQQGLTMLGTCQGSG